MVLRRNRQTRRALVDAALLAELGTASSAVARNVNARSRTWARATVVSRSPKPLTGGSTPSEPAFNAPDNQAGHPQLDNYRGIIRDRSSHRSRMGRSRHGGAPGSKPAVSGHRRFD